MHSLLALLALAATQPQKPVVLSAEELTSVRSLVGGSPQWFPDGTRLLIGGALGGSDLWSVPVEGGFPESLNMRMGETAFLQSNQPRFSPDGKYVAYLAEKDNATEL